MIIDWVSDFQAALLIWKWFIIIFLFLLAGIAWVAYKIMEWWGR